MQGRTCVPGKATKPLSDPSSSFMSHDGCSNCKPPFLTFTRVMMIIDDNRWRCLSNYLDKLGVVRAEDPSPLTDLLLRSTSARTARLTEEPELIIVLFGPCEDLPLKVRRVDQVKVA